MSTKKSKTNKRPARQEARLIDLNRVSVQEDFQINGQSLGRFNTRENFGDLKELGESLKASFENDPFSVPPLRGHFKGKDFILTDGERRYRAALEAGMTEYPVLTFPENPLDRIVAQAQLNAGKDFNDYEAARLCQRIATALTLVEPDVYKSTKASNTRDEVMRLMGISQATWYNYWDVLEAPKEALVLVEKEELTATALREIMREHKSPKEIVSAAKELVAEVKRDVKASTTAAAKDKKASTKKSKPKASSTTRKKLKAKKTPFQKKPFAEKYEAVLQKIANSGTPGAQLLLAFDHALRNEEKNLAQIVELVNSANMKPTKTKAKK